LTGAHPSVLSSLSYVSSALRSGWNDSRTSSPFPRSGGGRGNSADRPANGHVSPFGGARRNDRNDHWGERPHNNYGGGAPRNDSGPRESFGYGVWRDGQHVVGGRNARLEKELYGDAEDPSKQHTGINFEKYDDIPVEATGAGVPEAVTAFTSPPLDPVLVENIGYARYTTPTPVQKYSIPIVTAKRDLMACAQVRVTGVSSMLLF
jgi:ATP-dependent RNA helicase DDX3X